MLFSCEDNVKHSFGFLALSTFSLNGLCTVYCVTTFPVAAVSSIVNFLLRRAVILICPSWEAVVIHLGYYPGLLEVPEYWNCFHSVESVTFKYSHISLLPCLSELLLSSMIRHFPDSCKWCFNEQTVLSLYMLKSNTTLQKFS